MSVQLTSDRQSAVRRTSPVLSVDSPSSRGEAEKTRLDGHAPRTEPLCMSCVVETVRIRARGLIVIHGWAEDGPADLVRDRQRPRSDDPGAWRRCDGRFVGERRQWGRTLGVFQGGRRHPAAFFSHRLATFSHPVGGVASRGRRTPQSVAEAERRSWPPGGRRAGRRSLRQRAGSPAPTRRLRRDPFSPVHHGGHGIAAKPDPESIRRRGRSRAPTTRRQLRLPFVIRRPVL